MPVCMFVVCASGPCGDQKRTEEPVSEGCSLGGSVLIDWLELCKALLTTPAPFCVASDFNHPH